MTYILRDQGQLPTSRGSMYSPRDNHSAHRNFRTTAVPLSFLSPYTPLSSLSFSSFYSLSHSLTLSLTLYKFRFHTSPSVNMTLLFSAIFSMASVASASLNSTSTSLLIASSSSLSGRLTFFLLALKYLATSSWNFKVRCERAGLATGATRRGLLVRVEGLLAGVLALGAGLLLFFCWRSWGSCGRACWRCWGTQRSFVWWVSSWPGPSPRSHHNHTHPAAHPPSSPPRHRHHPRHRHRHRHHRRHSQHHPPPPPSP